MSPEKDPQHWPLVFGAAVGALVALGKLLDSNEPLTRRVVIGRLICNAALGAAAALIWIWFPDAPKFVMGAASCAVASLGTSFFEGVARKYLTKRI